MPKFSFTLVNISRVRVIHVIRKQKVFFMNTLQKWKPNFLTFEAGLKIWLKFGKS